MGSEWSEHAADAGREVFGVAGAEALRRPGHPNLRSRATPARLPFAIDDPDGPGVVRQVDPLAAVDQGRGARGKGRRPAPPRTVARHGIGGGSRPPTVKSAASLPAPRSTARAAGPVSGPPRPVGPADE